MEHLEVSSDALNVVKTFEVVTAPVEDVERVLLVGYDVHRLHVMDSRGSDVEEGWDLGLDVVQRMHLDSSLPFSEQRPFEDAQTQVDGCRVEGIDVAAKLEDLRCSALTGLCYHAAGELLEDAVVATAVGLGKVALCRGSTEP